MRVIRPRAIKTKLGKFWRKFPASFWIVFGIFTLLIVLPVMAYFGFRIFGAGAPSVTTRPVTGITQTSAILSGTSSPEGVTERGFEYGVSASYGQQTTDNSPVSYKFNREWGSQGGGDGQFYWPEDTEIDSQGNIYVVDRENRRVQKFDSDGNYLLKWGTHGSGEGEFIAPRGIAIDSQDNVYITDWQTNNRVQKFDSDGNFVLQWGSPGTGDGQFQTPQGIVIDDQDLVYVTEGNGNRIQVFDSSGNFVRKWGTEGCTATNSEFDGSFCGPYGMAIYDDEIYVADVGNDRIQVFDLSGNFVRKWGTKGCRANSLMTDTSLCSPGAIEVDSAGKIYVLDGENRRIITYETNGTYVSQRNVVDPDEDFNPEVRGITFDDKDNLYIADTFNNRIVVQSFIINSEVNGLQCGRTYHYRAYATNAQGTAYGDDQTFDTLACDGEPPDVSTWQAVSIMPDSAVLEGRNSPFGVTERGIEYGTSTSYGTTIEDQAPMSYSFSSKWSNSTNDALRDVAVDSNDNVYVRSGLLVKKYTKQGDLLLTIDGSTSNVGAITGLGGIGIDSQDNVYINSSYTILKYDPNGNLLLEFGEEWPGNTLNEAGFYGVRDIAVDSNGFIYVRDSTRILKYSPAGSFVVAWGKTLGDPNYLDFGAGIDIDSSDTIYTVEAGATQKVVTYDTSGNRLGSWGTSGSAEGQLSISEGRIALDATNTKLAIVSIQSAGRVSVFSTDGTFIERFGPTGANPNTPADSEIGTGRGVAFDSKNNIYVTDVSSDGFSPADNLVKVFDSSISVIADGLSCGTTYHYRAYATNASGTSYGEDDTFATEACPPGVVPTVTTEDATNINAGSAKLNGATSVNGVTERGFEYGPNTSYAQSITDTSTLGYTYNSEIGSHGANTPGLIMANSLAINPANGSYAYVADIYNARIQKLDLYGEQVDEWGSKGSGEGEFSGSINVTVGDDGIVYVADAGNHRIQVFDANGNFIDEWGSQGTGNGQFSSPTDIAIDSQGNIYVADSGNSRIQILSPSGEYITKFGSYGVDQGQFSELRYIAIDSNDNLYARDIYNIQKFNSNQSYVTTFGELGSGDGYLADGFGDLVTDTANNVYVTDPGNNQIQKFNSSGTFMSKWGVRGTGNGEFIEPKSIAIESNGVLHVVGDGGRRVQQFWSSNNSYIGEWASYGSGQSDLYTPRDSAVDSEGNLYVVDAGNNRIQKYDAQGNYQLSIGSLGNGDGELDSPWAVAVDSLNNVYVTDYNNLRVQKFNSSGYFITKWGNAGSGNGQFTDTGGVTGISIDSEDNVYVADPNNHRIQKFDSDGVYLSQFGTFGNGNGQFYRPMGIDTDQSGNVYVSDWTLNRIQKFNTSGSYVSTWGTGGNDDGEFSIPFDVEVDSSGYVYIADSGNNRIQKFDEDGNFITKWGSEGNGQDQFLLLFGISSDSSGNIYATDAFIHRVVKFTGSIEADLTSLSCETTYHFRAYATNSNGTGYGDDATFTTGACGSSGDDFNLVGIPNVTYVGLTWDEYVDAELDNYLIQFKESDSDEWMDAKFVEKEYLDTIVYGLQPSTEYNFRIAARDGSNVVIEQSNEITVTTLAQTTYEITNCEEFQAIDLDYQQWRQGNVVEGDMTGRYLIMNDIDCSETRNWEWLPEEENNPKGLLAFGMFQGSFFSGAIIGQGHTISNIYQADWSQGIAYATYGARFQDVSFTNVEIVDPYQNFNAGTSFTNAAVLTTFDNVNLSGSFTKQIEPGDYAPDSNGGIFHGNLFGMGVTNTVINTDVNVDVAYTIEDADFETMLYGGIVGVDVSNGIFDLTDVISEQYFALRATDISGSSSTGDVSIVGNNDQTTQIMAGGITGLGNADMSKVYSTSSLTLSNHYNSIAGGIVALNTGGEISNVYYDGNIQIDNSAVGSVAAGIAAQLMSLDQPYYDQAVLSDSYSAGLISIDDSVGAITGGLVAAVAGDGVGEVGLTSSFSAMNTETSNIELLEETHTGGLVAMVPDLMDGLFSMSGNYLDQTRSGTDVCVGVVVNDQAEPVNNPYGCTKVNLNNSQPNYFIANKANPPLNGWNFTSIWRTNYNRFPDFVGSTRPVDPGGDTEDPDNPDPEDPGGGGGGTTTPATPPITPDSESSGNPSITPGASDSPLPTNLVVQGAAIGPLQRFINAIPGSVARSIPWTLLLLLIALSLYYIYMAYLEEERRKELRSLIDRFKAAQLARQSYLDITSHYINTPLSVMQGTVQVLASKREISEELNMAASSQLDKLSKQVQALLAQAQQTSTGQSAVVTTLERTTIASLITKPYVWVPLAVSYSLAILANFVFIQADKYEPSLINFGAQVGIAIVGMLAIVSSVYYWQRMKHAKQLVADELELEKQYSYQQAEFISQAYETLSADLTALNVLGKTIVEHPQGTPFTEALAKLEKTIFKLETLGQLARTVPGQSWKTDVNQAIEAALVEARQAADAKQVTITTHIEPNLIANMGEAGLVHVMRAPLMNAIQFSEPGSQVSFSAVPADHSIVVTTQDHGKGMDQATLGKLFQPFSRSSTEQFNYEGMGLDLYLTRVVLEQSGGTVAATSQVGNGTRIMIKLPPVV